MFQSHTYESMWEMVIPSLDHKLSSDHQDCTEISHGNPKTKATFYRFHKLVISLLKYYISKL